MSSVRVILFGFQKMAEFVFSPMVREMTGVKNVEIVHCLRELEKVDNSSLIDILVINAMAIGFNMGNQLQRIKTLFPEAYLMCISPHRISAHICGKFVKNGIDALIANIITLTEYKRAIAAIRMRRRYYPPELRLAFEENDPSMYRGYRFLSCKEYETLAMTLKGLTLKEIADRLAVAETTACTMRKKAFKKMGVRSLVDLVKIGVQFNIHYAGEKEDAV